MENSRILTPPLPRSSDAILSSVELWFFQRAFVCSEVGACLGLFSCYMIQVVEILPTLHELLEGALLDDFTLLQDDNFVILT